MLLKCAVLKFASTRGRAEVACLRAISRSAKPNSKHRVEVSAECGCECGCEDRRKRIGVGEFGRSWCEYRSSSL